YLESVPAARKFMSAARAAARLKPVVVLKPGRHEAAAKAAATHTGALAGRDEVIDAAFRRAGIIRVSTIEELFQAAEMTAHFASLHRARVAIVTNGGGAGVLAVDELLDRGCELATLETRAIAALDRCLPPTWSHANPIDIIGDATPDRYGASMEAAASDPGVDLILAMNCPTALASPAASAEVLTAIADKGHIRGKPVIACWLGQATAEPARALLRKGGVATADTPAAAAQATRLLTDWARLKDRLERVPEVVETTPVRHDVIRTLLQQVAAEGRHMLTEPEAKTLLGAAGVTSPEIVVAGTPAEVERVAARLLGVHRAIVVKLFSKSITHKSDVGGVVLNLTTPGAAHAAAEAIARRVDATHPGGLDGFTLQPMVERPDAQELLVGIHTDANFGPVLVFGAGGTAVEVLRDTQTGLLPLDDVLAADLIDGTRIGRLLAGYRNRPPADREAIVGTMLALTQLVIENPAIVAVDVNPLLADHRGVVALDARIEIDSSRMDLAGPNPLLAVRPYPVGWNSEKSLGTRSFYIRPIRPADARLYPTLMSKMTAEDLRMRFLVPTAHLSEETIIRLSQLDYDRDIAFVAIDQHDGSLAAVVRYAADPDHIDAEFGALVRSDLQGIGLGHYLMQRLIDYARADGLQTLTGVMLRENGKMIELARRLGFVTIEPGEGGEDTIRMSLRL
ncbi:MAG TPA: GNAT family N-acetyltransferase, partial [Devosia sp.]